MNKINWGIIGCGDVTEVKSGPAFNKVPGSSLVAVMRRDAAKAKDYATRHNVPKWYSNANDLINDPGINAIYVATPPSSHEEYTVAALKAGKPVYVEKPMTLNEDAAKRMKEAADTLNVKLTVAHYRREMPFFRKINELLKSNVIGRPKIADLTFFAPSLSSAELMQSKTAWRIDPAISGGGLFHDLAPHQLDLMLHYFGRVKSASGASINQSNLYDADDTVLGNILFENGTMFTGAWCFSVPEEETKDECKIIGSEGSLSFSVFGDHKITLTTGGKTEIISFNKLEHVQQPMIEKVVQYFLDKSYNPCPPEDAVEVMRLMDVFTTNE